MSSEAPRVRAHDFAAQWSKIESDATEAFRTVGASGRYILGPEVDAFERELAASWGTDHVIGVGNGLEAIEVALRAVGIRPGAKVLTTPLSAFASTLAIVRAGGVPVFVDVDEQGLLDLDEAEAALAADPSIRHVLPVHLFGHPLDLDRLERMARERGVALIEDCAQAIGASWGGRRVGTVGAAAAVSFYPTKNLGALGDGGAVLTADPELALRARQVRHSGRSFNGRHDRLGLNSRLDELQAALLRRALMPRWPGWAARRREIAERYLARLRSPDVRPVPVSESAVSAWHLFPVRVEADRRSDFRSHLLDRGVETGIHYRVAIPDQKALDHVPAVECLGDLSRARRFVSEVVSLPLHPFLSDDDVEVVLAAVASWSVGAADARPPSATGRGR